MGKRAKPDETLIEPNVVLVKARQRSIKYPPTFYQYLSYHRRVSGPVGTMAYFVLSDKCWPRNAKSKESVRMHLIGHHGLKGDQLFLLHETYRCYLEFIASHQQIPNQAYPTEDYIKVRHQTLTLSLEAWAMFKDLTNPNKRAPGANCHRPAVLEDGIRLLHAKLFGNRPARIRGFRADSITQDDTGPT